MVEASVREQLGTERAELERMLENRADVAELAAAFGRMGQLYHAYDLLSPAAACYRNALRLEPGHGQWLYHLGGVYQRQGRLDVAAETLSEALVARPDNAALRLRLGRVELARAHPAPARAHFERALAAEPECAAARYGLGEAARAAGDLEAAVEHFHRTLLEQPDALQVLYPLGQTLLRLGREQEGEKFLARSARRRMSVGARPTCPDPWDEELSGLTRSAAAHLTRGLHHAYNGRYPEALGEYRKALALEPGDPVVRQSLGSALAGTGDFAGALEQYREAVRLAPEDPDLNKDLGVVAAGLGQLEEARRHLERALELRPEFHAARLQLAGVAQQQGRFEQAAELYSQVLEADPTDSQARIERTRCLIRLGRRAQVTEEIGRFLDLRPPSDPMERVQLAMLLATLGDVTRALRHLTAVSRLDAPPGVRAQALLRIGQIRLLTGDRGAAAESLSAALELDPDLQEAKSALAQLSRR